MGGARKRATSNSSLAETHGDGCQRSVSSTDGLSNDRFGAYRPFTLRTRFLMLRGPILGPQSEGTGPVAASMNLIIGPSSEIVHSHGFLRFRLAHFSTTLRFVDTRVRQAATMCASQYQADQGFQCCRLTHADAVDRTGKPLITAWLGVRALRAAAFQSSADRREG